MKNRYRIAALLAALLLIPMYAAWAEEKPDFEIDPRQVLYGMNRSWLQGYTPSVSNNVLNLVLPILSDRAEGAIQAELIMPDERVSPFKPQTMFVRVQRGDSGTWAVRLSLEMYADRRNGDYPCVLRLTGTGRAGEALRADIPYTLRIRDGADTDEALYLALENVTADLKLGEDGAVTARLTNPCQTVAYERISLRVTDPAGDVIPQTVDLLRAPDLGPGESASIRFPVKVLPKASVSPHRLQFQLEWTALGKAVTQSESYTLPVTQEIRLEQGGLKMASSVVAGDSVTLSLPLMNMGRGSVVNVLATVSLPGIADRQSVLVGTIGPGETRQAQITLTPGKNVSGDFSGVLTVTAADEDGNPASLSLPVSLTVEKPPAAEKAPDAAQESPEEAPLLPLLLGAGCGALLIALVLQGALLRRKIRRLEEAQL